LSGAAGLILRASRLSEPAKGHAAMLLFSMLVAGSFALGAMVARDIAPTALNAARFAIAAGVIGALVMATGCMTRKDWQAPWRYLILGGLFSIYFVLMFEGLKTAPPVSAAAVFTLTPILSGLAGWVLLRQITTGWMALALAIGGSGALWVIFRADIAAFLAFEIGRGEAIYFVGCIAHAIYTPMIAKLHRGERPLAFSFGTLLACVVVLSLWGWSLAPAALGQGDGLYLPDAKLGHFVANSLEQRSATRRCVGRGGAHGCGAGHAVEGALTPATVHHEKQRTDQAEAQQNRSRRFGSAGSSGSR